MSLLPNDLSTVDEFLENDAFRTWVLERRPEDQLVWQEWLARYPEKRETYEQAVATLLVLQGKTIELSDQQVKDKAEAIVENLPDIPTGIKPLASWYWGRWVAAAAVVSLIVWWQFRKPVSDSFQLTIGNKLQKQQLQSDNWTIVKNVTEQPMVVLLPDNSSVLLSAGSQLRFQKQANHALREVFLQGEGFFEVSKNPARPFIVYTPTLTTRVVGTSFEVHSFGKETTSFVRVKTGRVSVTPIASPKKSVMLTVNEQLSLDTRKEQVVTQKSELADEHSTDIIAQKFTFNYTPIPEIFDQLEASYHITFRYDRELLKNCTFTGQLNDVSFLEKIRLICLTIESTFEVVDNQVVIHSRGCN